MANILRDDALRHMLDDLAHVGRDDKPAPQIFLVEKRRSDLNLAGGKESRPLKSIWRNENCQGREIAARKGQLPKP
jgi:hypothetical protein